MIILGRVFCDLCECSMGQVFEQSPPRPDQLPDLSTAPHFAVCPDCLEAACEEAA